MQQGLAKSAMVLWHDPRCICFQLHSHPLLAAALRLQYGGRLQALIAVSDPLVWATTPPPAPLPTAPDVTWDHPYSTPPDQQLLTATAGAAPELPPGTLTDADVPRRSPCLAAAATWEVETTVVRAARKGRLRTHVVCPGLLYGAGESDSFLHPTFKCSWEVDQGTPEVYGSGANRLPMLHVADLSQYVAELAAAVPAIPSSGGTAGGTLTSASLPLSMTQVLSPTLVTAATLSPSSAAAASALPLPPSYCLVVDEGAATQRQVTEAVSKLLGTGQVTEVPKQQLMLRTGLDRFTLDLAFATTALPAACAFKPAYGAGFLAHLPEVAEQYKAYRNISPLRLVVLGPPMAGKSALAQRLARRYGLPYFNAKELIETAKEYADPDLAKQVATEMSGKEPRVTSKTLAALLQTRLTGKKLCNRGYVLDALPKSAATTKWAFMQAVPLTPEEVAAKEREERDSTARAASPSKPGAKGADKGGAKGGKDAKGKAGAAAPTDGPEVPPGHKLGPHPLFAPSHVIMVEAEEGTLRARLKAVEAAELEAAKAAVAAAGPPAKGAKEKPIVVPGHNNERDFARRMDAWTKARQEDDEDLAVRVAAAEQRWAAQQAEEAEQRRKAEAEASTLRARRRRAREQALAATAALATGGTQADASIRAEETLVSNPDATAQLVDGALTASLDGTPFQEETGVSTAALPQGPQLPQFGGLFALLVHDCGAKFVKVENNSADGPDNTILLPPTAGAAAVAIPSAEAVAEAVLGEPHNFEGFVANEPPPPPPVLRPENSMMRRERETREHEAAVREALLAQRAAAADATRQAALQRSGFQSSPLQQWLMSELMPVVTEGLVSIVRDRPAAPLRALAERLMQQAVKMESTYVDPYTDPIYEIQAEKIKAKAQRDQERADAEKAKEERERAAKLASREAAQQQQMQQEQAAAAVA